MPSIASVQLMVGLEVHVELATRTKMFSRAPSPAHAAGDAAEPNTLIDPTVLALPGALPVMNLAAVEMSMMVGMALGCTIAPQTKWDRKGYFYPDLPKGYQISQYDLPLCFDGMVRVPRLDDKGLIDPEAEPRQIGIIRAHLEEDAGKLLHEAPGGGAGAAIDFSIVDLNRAGTPLLEIVTQPDFDAADQAVSFARMLRDICRFLGATQGVMQKGHIRFEPNINTIITLDDGRQVKTPIVEIKNLNSFKALKGAIEHELAEQPRRWLQDGREMGRGMKSTRGWDDAKGQTFLQREKEDAHDYRYFPDPDLVPVIVSDRWREEVRARIPELPLDRFRRYIKDYELSVKEADALIDEREVCFFYEACIAQMVLLGIEAPRAGRLAANMVLQSGAKRANERGSGGAGGATGGASTPVLVSALGISPAQVAAIAKLREDGRISFAAADELFGLYCEPGSPHAEQSPADLAAARGLLIVRDTAALDAWCEQAIAQQAQAAADVRAGRMAAMGRLVGAAMKASAGGGDAKAIRQRLEEKLAAKP
jgi:aspartyl-tRNA(Asn)/glutamyl-tRNA(Gln) amidotransferase subunit B